MPEKSARKSASGRPFIGKGDHRNGHGPEPGAPNAGRPPSAVAAAYRKSFAERLHIAEQIADDPGATNMERLKALELLGKFGGMTSVQVTGEDGAALMPRQYVKFGDRTIAF